MIRGWIYSSEIIDSNIYGKIPKEVIFVKGNECESYTWDGLFYVKNQIRMSKNRADRITVEEPLENKRFKVITADREGIWSVFCKDEDEVKEVVSDETQGHLERGEYSFNIKVEEV